MSSVNGTSRGATVVAWGEPASANISFPSPVPLQGPPTPPSIPVFASLPLEELIELQHLVARDHEGLQPRQHLAQQVQVVVHLALAVAPHVAAGAPEDEHRALAHVEQVVAVAEDPLDAGMGDDPQAGAIAHVAPVAARGGVIHADDTLGLVDLRALLAAQQMSRACHQGTVPAVHLQGLKGTRRRTPLAALIGKKLRTVPGIERPSKNILAKATTLSFVLSLAVLYRVPFTRTLAQPLPHPVILTAHLYRPTALTMA